MGKTYLVQTWDKDGAQQNHYEVVLATDRELGELKKFLKSKFGQVLITRQPARPTKKR